MKNTKIAAIAEITSFSLFIYLLAVGGCVSGSVPALPVAKSFTPLQKFEAVKAGMTEAEVAGIVGTPSRHAGSGVAYDVYDLLDGSSVWIAWQKGKVSWLFHKYRDGKQEPLNTEPKATGKSAP